MQSSGAQLWCLGNTCGSHIAICPIVIIWTVSQSRDEMRETFSFGHRCANLKFVSARRNANGNIDWENAVHLLRRCKPKQFNWVEYKSNWVFILIAHEMPRIFRTIHQRTLLRRATYQSWVRREKFWFRLLASSNSELRLTDELMVGQIEGVARTSICNALIYVCHQILRWLITLCAFGSDQGPAKRLFSRSVVQVFIDGSVGGALQENPPRQMMPLPLTNHLK